MRRVVMFADIPCSVALLWAVSDWVMACSNGLQSCSSRCLSFCSIEICACWHVHHSLPALTVCSCCKAGSC